MMETEEANGLAALSTYKPPQSRKRIFQKEVVIPTSFLSFFLAILWEGNQASIPYVETTSILLILSD